jgi:integrase
LGASVRRPTAGARTGSATRIRTDFGLKAVQILLGHSKADMTQIYAERDAGRAVAVAAKIG